MVSVLINILIFVCFTQLTLTIWAGSEWPSIENRVRILGRDLLNSGNQWAIIIIISSCFPTLPRWALFLSSSCRSRPHHAIYGRFCRMPTDSWTTNRDNNRLGSPKVTKLDYLYITQRSLTSISNDWNLLLYPLNCIESPTNWTFIPHCFEYKPIDTSLVIKSMSNIFS